MTEKLRKPLELWHVIIGLAVTVSTPLIVGAVQYGKREAEFEQVKATNIKQDERLDTLESSSARTDRNVITIGTKLGVKMEMPSK